MTKIPSKNQHISTSFFVFRAMEFLFLFNEGNENEEKNRKNKTKP